MCAGAAERIHEREVADEGKFAEAGFQDWPKLQRERIFLSRKTHVVELDVAAELDRPIESLRYAEMHLGAGAGIFVIAVFELRGRQILADLQPSQQAVCCLQRFVYLVRVHRRLCLSARGGVDGVRMQLELQMSRRSGLGVVNLNLVKIYRACAGRPCEHAD